MSDGDVQATLENLFDSSESKPPLEAVALPEDYYLQNFLCLLDFVLNKYQDILCDQEYIFFRSFYALSADAQKLYVRLLTRKGDWFRLDKLNYQEIDSRAAATQELQTQSLVKVNADLTLDDVIALFTKAELLKTVEVCSLNRKADSTSSLKSLKRPQLEAWILGSDYKDDVLLHLTQQHNLIFLKHRHYFQLLKLCFFGNLYQSLTDFVLRDMGLNIYETYSLEAQQLPFQNRQSIGQHLQYYETYQLYEDCDKQNAEIILGLLEALPTEFQTDVTLKRRVEKLRIKMARQLERIGELEAALSHYALCQRHPGRERMTRIYVQQEDFDKAFDQCRDILNAPYNEEESEFAKSFAFRLQKKQTDSQHTWPQPIVYESPSETVYLSREDYSEQPIGVERLAASYLSLYGDCYYLENTLFNGLLGLLIWDIIFYPIQGVFFNPFQMAPSDFKGNEFYLAREKLLEDRLLELEDGSYKSRIRENWRAKFGISNPLVFWQALTPEILERAIEEIPATDLLAMFTRILDNVSDNRSGFPDLILFPENGGYVLIEVKGPGDTLQKNQIRWLKYFDRHCISHKVLYVRYND